MTADLMVGVPIQNNPEMLKRASLDAAIARGLHFEAHRRQ